MKGSHSIEVDLTFPISYFLPGLRCYEEVTLLSGLDLFLPMNYFLRTKKYYLRAIYISYILLECLILPGISYHPGWPLT